MYSKNPDSPKVFISYSHDSRKHINRVLELSARLCANGVDCNLVMQQLRKFGQ